MISANPIGHIGRRAEDFLNGGPDTPVQTISLSELHCPYLSPKGIEFECEGLLESERADLQKYLPLLLTDMVRGSSLDDSFIALLVGIQEYGCQPGYPVAACDGHALARVLIHYVGAFNSQEMELFAVRHIIDLLNAWVKPDVPWVCLPGVMTLCRTIYGHDWCSMFLPDCHDTVGAYCQISVGFEIDHIIRKEKPPFMPGLCPEQDAVIRVPLPDLGMSL